MYDFLYRSSVETIAQNCLVFEKIAFFLHFGDRQTDRQIDEQMDSIDALSRSRCRERRLSKELVISVSTRCFKLGPRIACFGDILSVYEYSLGETALRQFVSFCVMNEQPLIVVRTHP